MPNITVSRTVIEKKLGKKISDEELKDRISMLGTDLDGIEGDNIEVEIFPNRPDLLSEQGFARALSSFMGIDTGLKTFDVNESDYKVIVDKSVTMRPYTACAVVKNLTLSDANIKELMNIQEKLATTHGRRRKKSAYGIYPLQNINFPVHYIAKDPSTIMFHPLGMEGPIKASAVEDLHPKGKAYKDVAKGWTKYPFFIDAKDNVMCMLPYTNSNDTGKVDTTTKEVFIECSGTDLENVKVALNILTTTLADMGGDVYAVDVVYDKETITTPELVPVGWEVTPEYINKLLGLTLSEKELQQLFAKMGHEYKDGTVLVPAYRADIMHKVDFVEEVAIAYGYENFNAVIPNVNTVAKEDPIEVRKRIIAQLLTGLGMLETETYNLTNNASQNEKMGTDIPLITLKSAVNTEHDALRAWVTPSLMEVLANNRSAEYPQRLFGVGRIFKEGKTETGVLEQERLAITCCDEQADFTTIKQVFDYLMRMLDLEYTMEETEHPSFIPGRAARVSVNNKHVAYIGEVHPQVLENFGLEYPVAACELNITELFEE